MQSNDSARAAAAFVCKYCGKDLKGRSQLKIHLLQGKFCSDKFQQDPEKDVSFLEQNCLQCKYCGRKGFLDQKGLATHRRYSKSCFQAWKVQQDAIDASKTKVKCQVCGKLLRNISNTHLKTHNMTQQEYKQKYPYAKIFSQGLLQLQKELRQKRIFQRFGQDRSYLVTNKESYIRKYGEQQGLTKYQQHLKKMSHSKQTYIEKYGQEQGSLRYHTFYKKRKQTQFYQSKPALQLFDSIKATLPNQKLYYYNNPAQFGIYLHQLGSYCFVDLYIPGTNKVVQFYGDYWHANPEVYQAQSFIDFPDSKTIQAKYIWQKDSARIQAIKKQLGCQTLIVWQSEYNKNKKEVLQKVLSFITEKDKEGL